MGLYPRVRDILAKRCKTVVIAGINLRHPSE